MPLRHAILLLAILLAEGLPGIFAADPPAALPRVAPEAVGMSTVGLAMIDDIVNEGLSQSRMPGCVVLAGRRDGVVFRRAYGHRQTQPTAEPMTEQTVFDLASLTKPIATATAIMLLVQDEKLRLDDRVANYLPDFAAAGKQDITIHDLLTHQGGLIPDNPLSDYEDGPETAFRRIDALSLTAEPRTRFLYSDVGFIVLGRVVEAVSGHSLHEFTQQRLFGPLEMNETGFLPPESLRVRCAPTEQREGHWMQGEVHDPRAFELGGVAGHAGLFSTADDLARYAAMMVGGGRLGDTEILNPVVFEQFTRPVAVSSGLRSPGWDVRTGYSSNRGDLFSAAAVGHGGFTGTAIWMDPEQDLFVIFLSNRVHPNGDGNVNSLAGRIGTVAAAALRDPSGDVVPSVSGSVVLNGIDVLQRDGFRPLHGRRVGLITNHTGINRDGVSTARLLHACPDVNLVMLFSPEHGLDGRLDIARIADTSDQSTGLQVVSLYGESRTPSAEQLQQIDTLVFDIQDIGTRFYTYVSTMGNALRAAGEHDVRFVVLDRVNPIGGVVVDGPVLDDGMQSFVGFHPIAVRHGMTVGELAQMIRAERSLSVDLQVIPVEGWQRDRQFDETGLLWKNPSPNMRTLNQAVLYPGIGLVELTNVSVGRGTDTPFELLGAPWIHPQDLARELNSAGLPGIRFVPIRFTPSSSRYEGLECGGVQILITDRRLVQSVRIGIEMACALHRMYPDDWQTASLNRLLCDQAVCDAILAGTPPSAVRARWQPELLEFMQRRSRFLLYP